MTTRLLKCLIPVLLALHCALHSVPSVSAEPLRAGIIGCDTSHVPAFTKLLNKSGTEGPLDDVQVVAAFPGGSDDIPASYNRVDKFTEQLRGMGIEIVDSIDALIERVDVVLLESVDGRPHLAQARPVLIAGKPLFVDKPAAGSLADVIEIFDLAKQHNTPCFSSSGMRFVSPVRDALKSDEIGELTGCDTFGPFSIESHHPDLFWYGVHGVEMLYAIMGTGCEQVTRTHTNNTELVVGVWKDGRIGTYRGRRGCKSSFGGRVFGTKSEACIPMEKSGGYNPLVIEIATFFKTGKPPVSAEETIELFAFMEAADESKCQGGAPVTIESILVKARAEVDARREIVAVQGE